MLSGSRLSLDEGTGTMLDLGLLGVILGKELTSPEGKKEVIRFLTSPEGMAILEEFFRSPDARPLAGNLLMPIPGNLGFLILSGNRCSSIFRNNPVLHSHQPSHFQAHHYLYLPL
jgi:hypothetical protein